MVITMEEVEGVGLSTVLRANTHKVPENLKQIRQTFLSVETSCSMACCEQNLHRCARMGIPVEPWGGGPCRRLRLWRW